MTTSVHTSAPEKRGPRNLDRKHSGTWKSLPTPFPSGRLPATEIRLVLEVSFLTLTPHSPDLCALLSRTAQLSLPAGLTHHSGGWPRHCPGLRPWAHRKKPLVSALPSSSGAFLNVTSTHGRPQLRQQTQPARAFRTGQSCPHTQLSGPTRTRTPVLQRSITRYCAVCSDPAKTSGKRQSKQRNVSPSAQEAARLEGGHHEHRDRKKGRSHRGTYLWEVGTGGLYRFTWNRLPRPPRS